MVNLAQVPASGIHALAEGVAVADYAGFNHFAQQVVALTGAFADAGEHRHAAVFLGDIVDKFLNQHGLAYAGTAEETNLATLEEGLDKVDHLDAGIEDFLTGRQILELGRLAVDAVALCALGGGHAVDGLADDVEQTAVDVLAHRHRDGTAQRLHLHAALQTVGRVHGDAAHGVLTDVLLTFKNNLRIIGAFDFQCSINVWQRGFVLEINIHHGADDL